MNDEPQKPSDGDTFPGLIGAKAARKLKARHSTQGVWLGLGMMPGLIHNMFSGRLTREDFIDIPFLWVTAHTVWILTSLLIVFVMPGESLGLSSIGRRIYHAVARVLLFGSSRLK